jgi:hypothetical protein
LFLFKKEGPENPRVGGSIPPLGTIKIKDLAHFTIYHLERRLPPVYHKERFQPLEGPRLQGVYIIPAWDAPGSQAERW